MAKILFPVSSTPGPAGRPLEGQGRLVNAYAEGVDKKIVWRRVPGLDSFADHGLTANTPRGFIEVSGTLYMAVGSKVIRVASNGLITPLTGTLPGEGPVTFARNNKVPTPDLVVVADSTAFHVSSSALSNYTDPDVGSPLTVCGLDGYLVFSYGDGSLRVSDLNNTPINSLSVAKAESRPDGVIRVTAAGLALYAFGEGSIEVSQNAGTSPYPFARVAVIPCGIAGPFAVAGFEDGWDRAQYFVAADGTVRSLSGYSTDVVSTPDVERAIASTVDKTKLEACVYTANGRAIWALSGPGWTWEYSVTTGAWNERRSYGLTRWRGSQSVKAFGKWLVGDTQSTRLLALNPVGVMEYLSPLVWEVESAIVDRFPARKVIKRADFRFSAGVGSDTGIDPIQTTPRVSISWSDDGGTRFGTPVLRDLGRQGATLSPVSVTNAGRSSHIGRRWRLAVSDPVHVGFMGGEMSEPF
jgi:Phage stabilisation protein